MPIPVRKKIVKSRDVNPVWKGPEVDGITFSLLSRFLVCRERFRVMAIDGWRADEGFNHRIEYGNMWHVCEEAHASAERDWEEDLHKYVVGLARQYPLDAERVDHWYQVCCKQFPEYVAFWSRHPDVRARTPVLQEKSFKIPYQLPSGRRVLLRGKWDAIDWIGDKKGGLYLQENKTKSEINEVQIKRQLTFDLQTMMYLVAMCEQNDNQSASAYPEGSPNHDPRILKPLWKDYGPSDRIIKGVRYNVVRRPLSGGKGTIVRHKPSKTNPHGESKESYYDRVAEYIKDAPGEFFARWKIEVTASEIRRFRRECLDPILEQLCVWYDVVTKPNTLVHVNAFTLTQMTNWRHPFGVWNSLDEGGSTDLDEYLSTGSTVGLKRVDTLFPELN